METPLRLKMKVGDHEFEAEGPAEIVQAQLALFKEMIAAVPPSQRAGGPQEKQGEDIDSIPHQPIKKS